MEEVEVVYIAGAERSGSTLLGRILGKNPESVFVSELKGIRPRGECECGEYFDTCPKWSMVLDSSDIKSLQRCKDGYRSANLIFGEPNISDLNEVKKVYKKIATVFDKKIVVDSSKTPLHLFMLKKCNSVKLRVLHLVRDPRAVCDSLWRKPIRYGKRYKPIWKRSFTEIGWDNPIRNSILWLERNFLIEKISKGLDYHLLKYEDFCDSPDQELKKINKKFGKTYTIIVLVKEK